MTDELKTAFDGIRAEDNLKYTTSRFLCGELRKRGKSKRRAMPVEFAAALACIVIAFVSGILAYDAYITPVAYVDVDINPSIELTLNRFDRVIGVRAYTDDSANIVERLPFRHKSYSDALMLLMDSVAGQGYLQAGGLVSVTLQTNDISRETELLSDIQAGIEEYMTGHHQTAQIEVFPVSGDLRNYSYEKGVSPAKYLAILELIEVDPSASMESCRGHSISEIKQMTKEHGVHHGESADSTTAAPTSDVTGHRGNEERVPDVNAVGSGHEVEKHEGVEVTARPAQGGGHHGGGTVDRKHGRHN